MKTPFNVFAIFPKLYVKGSARELNENESHYRPPYTASRPGGQAFFCDILPIIFMYIMAQEGLDLALNNSRRLP